MSDNVIPFNDEQEHDHHCETCDIVDEFFNYIIDAETPQEVHEILSDFIVAAKDLGVKEYLLHEIGNKIHLLKHLEGECCEDCCAEDECDC